MKRIITIGRELGSGGRTIGKMVADRQTLALAAQVYETQVEVVRKFAQKGSCVIVGRCGYKLLENR